MDKNIARSQEQEIKQNRSGNITTTYIERNTKMLELVF